MKIRACLLGDHDRSFYRSEHGNDRIASEQGHRDRSDRERCGYEDYYREYYNRKKCEVSNLLNIYLIIIIVFFNVEP